MIITELTVGVPVKRNRVAGGWKDLLRGPKLEARGAVGAKPISLVPPRASATT
jgi:hypothetical protein